MFSFYIVIWVKVLVILLCVFVISMFFKYIHIVFINFHLSFSSRKFKLNNFLNIYFILFQIWLMFFK